MSRFELHVSPVDANARAAFADIHLVAGDTAAARDYFEQALEIIPDQVNPAAQLFGFGILPMIAVKRDAGEMAAAERLIRLSHQHLDVREAANMTGDDDPWFRGFLYIFKGRSEAGLALLRRSVAAGYAPGFVDRYLIGRFPDVDFGPLLEDFEARRTPERDKFLSAVCNDGNPAPEVWTPIPKTCEGYVVS